MKRSFLFLLIALSCSGINGSSRFFYGKENERVPGKRTEENYNTDERKLEFLQKYGWLKDDSALRKSV
jgi:hypothetical protein